MNYVVKYSIANCVFGYMNEAQLKVDTAYIGIFSLSEKGMYEIDFGAIDFTASITGAITIRSELGGGIGFPQREGVLEILQNDHGDLAKAFIDTIAQENIVLFDDGERYTPVMMEMILKILKEAGKNVIAVSIEPARFEGRNRRRVFDASWNEIGSMTDEAILLPLIDESKSISEIHYLQRYETLKTIANLWKKVE